MERVDRPDLFNQYKEHIIWANIDSQDWLTKVFKAFKIIQKSMTSTVQVNVQPQHISDIVILLPTNTYGLECVNFFLKKGINVNHVFDNKEEEEQEKEKNSDFSKKRIVMKKHKRSFWMGDGRLKMSTIHSFKGWEVLNVIIFIPEKYSGSNEIYDRVVYTAITRTRQNLIVLNSNNRYKKFGENLPKSWD